MYKPYLALYNLQWLIRHKTKSHQTNSRQNDTFKEIGT